MSRFGILVKQDFRMTFRDPIFRFLLFFPLIAYGLIRYGWPFAAAQFPVILDYQELILMWACMQSASMFGFIYGFIVLEEKEDGLFAALKILPISSQELLLSRLTMGMLISSLVNFCLIQWGGIASITVGENILLSIQFSLLAPLFTLLISVLSANRLEGMAQMKLINLLMNLPALIYFLPFKWMHITAIIPTYWNFRSMEASLKGEGFWGWYLLAILVYAGVLGGLNYFFRRSG